MKTTTVTTYESPTRDGLTHRINVCADCEAAYQRSGRWPRDSKGAEFCQVHRGAHKGLCEAPVHLDPDTAMPT